MFTSQEDDATRIRFLTRSHCGLMGLLGGQALVSATCTLEPEHTAVESQGQSVEKMWRTLC